MNYNITYQRDAVNSYLVIKKDTNINIENYEVEMLERNSIDSFLDFSIRTFNTEKDIYYNITSKQQLIEIVERKKLNNDELVQFFTVLINIIKNCEKYYLNSNKILLQPNMIYIEPNGFKPSFIYIPFIINEDSIIDRIINLIQFFFDKIDQDDMRAVMTMHKIMAACKQSDFNITRLQDIVNNTSKKDKKLTHCNNENIKNEPVNMSKDKLNNNDDKQIISKLIEQNKHKEKNMEVKDTDDSEINNNTIIKKSQLNVSKKIYQNISKYINKSNENEDKIKKHKSSTAKKNNEEKIIKSSKNNNKLNNYFAYILIGTIQLIMIFLFLILLKSNILNSDVTGEIKIESLLAVICILLAVDIYFSKKIYISVNDKEKTNEKKISNKK